MGIDTIFIHMLSLNGSANCGMYSCNDKDVLGRRRCPVADAIHTSPGVCCEKDDAQLQALFLLDKINKGG